MKHKIGDIVGRWHDRDAGIFELGMITEIYVGRGKELLYKINWNIQDGIIKGYFSSDITRAKVTLENYLNLYMPRGMNDDGATIRS